MTGANAIIVVVDDEPALRERRQFFFNLLPTNLVKIEYVGQDKRVFFKNVELPALMGTPLKIMVGVSLACISLACLVYVLDVYDRYRFEQRARNQCYEVLQLEPKDLILQNLRGRWELGQFFSTVLPKLGSTKTSS
jgi:hypothetical protein